MLAGKGDRNTRFCHTKVGQGREENNVIKISYEARNNFEQEIDIAEVCFFCDLFTSGGNVDVHPMIKKLNSSLGQQMIDALSVPFTCKEIQEALFQMHRSRDLGPDDMSAMFFQKSWHILGGIL